MSTRWAEPYVGIPYLDGGLDGHGCSCWGLVRMVLREQAGIDLPPHGTIEARDLDAIARQVGAERISGDWTEVPAGDERRLDVVLMSNGINRAPTHVGVVIEPGRMLHVEAKTAAVIVPLSRPMIAPRVIAIYRHASLR